MTKPVGDGESWVHVRQGVEVGNTRTDETEAAGRGLYDWGLTSGNELYVCQDKPSFPGDRSCHVLQEHPRSLRFPGAQGEKSINEIFMKCTHTPTKPKGLS